VAFPQWIRIEMHLCFARARRNANFIGLTICLAVSVALVASAGPATAQPADVKIQNHSSSAATVAIPSDARGKNIHVVLELDDDGVPNLYAYRRVIIHVQ
jgi:hypothetical protein